MRASFDSSEEDINPSFHQRLWDSSRSSLNYDFHLSRGTGDHSMKSGNGAGNDFLFWESAYFYLCSLLDMSTLLVFLKLKRMSQHMHCFFKVVKNPPFFLHFFPLWVGYFSFSNPILSLSFLFWIIYSKFMFSPFCKLLFSYKNVID